MATTPPADTQLTHLDGKSYDLDAWVMSFNLLLTAIDPYTIESSWVLSTSARIYRHYAESDVRVGFLSTADAAGTRQFLGPFADEFLCFTDADRSFVEACELERLPSLLYIRQSGELTAANEGFDPEEWSKTLLVLNTDLAWRTQVPLPAPGDPRPFQGTPALG